MNMMDFRQIIDIGMILTFFILGMYYAKTEFNENYKIGMLIVFSFMFLASITDAIDDVWSLILLIAFPTFVYFLFKKQDAAHE